MQLEEEEWGALGGREEEEGEEGGALQCAYATGGGEGERERGREGER